LNVRRSALFPSAFSFEFSALGKRVAVLITAAATMAPMAAVMADVKELSVLRNPSEGRRRARRVAGATSDASKSPSTD
jgi:hypothetical protein